MMKDVTYCASADCPSTECKLKLTNNKNKFEPGEIISMADFSGTCRFYIAWLLEKIEDGE